MLSGTFNTIMPNTEIYLLTNPSLRVANYSDDIIKCVDNDNLHSNCVVNSIVVLTLKLCSVLQCSLFIA